MALKRDTHMERIGATASREAMRMPISQIPAVSSRAQVGSPLAFPWPNTWQTKWVKTEQQQPTGATAGTLFDFRCQTCKKGTMPSRAMACRSRGAPVRLCRPAPQQEKKEPITMTQGEGHDRVPITRFPFTESPNLEQKNIHVLKCILRLKHRCSRLTGV